MIGNAPTLHRNAPLSVEGRRRLIERCKTRPIAHVAAETGISRAWASKWVNRYHRRGELGLLDRPSTPRRQPTATAVAVVARIEHLRRTQKWSAARIASELQAEGIAISRRTVSRHLDDNGSRYRADMFARALLGARHQRITPYTPRHNRKVARYNRILAEEFLYARTWTSEGQRRRALTVWNIHYNYHRTTAEQQVSRQPCECARGVTNVLASYS
jgi:transposase